MTDLAICTGLAAWYAFGVWSLAYWITRKYDFTTRDLGVCLMGAVLGPIMFWVGRIVYGEERNHERVIVRRRQQS